MRTFIVLTLFLVACRSRLLSEQIVVDGSLLGSRDAAPDLGAIPDLLGDPSDQSELECGGFVGLPCPQGYFCDYPDLSCSNGDQPGRCVLKPSDCTGQTPAQVCGCDGKSYQNDCQRRSAGIGMAHPGTCQSTAFSCGSQTCGVGQYCFQGCCDAAGCAPPPPSCEPLPASCNGQPSCVCVTEVPSSLNDCRLEPDGSLYLTVHRCP